MPDVAAPPSDDPPGPTFDLSIYVEPQGIVCEFQCEGRKVQWTMPRTVVRRANKAMTIDYVFDLFGAGPMVGYYLREAATNEPEFLMVPRGQRPDRPRDQGPAARAKGAAQGGTK